MRDDEVYHSSDDSDSSPSVEVEEEEEEEEVEEEERTVVEGRAEEKEGASHDNLEEDNQGPDRRR